MNHRINEEIRRAAVALLEGREIVDLDEGSDENRRYRSLRRGAALSVARPETNEEAVSLVCEGALMWRREA